MPGLGIAGAGVAVTTFSLTAAVVLMRSLTCGRSLVKLRRVRLEQRLFGDILRVGLPSALGAVQFNLVTVLVTGAVGLFGTEALAGYGIAVRLDYVLIPLVNGGSSCCVSCD
jgi:Na+-driven multidrug efflux pump